MTLHEAVAAAVCAHLGLPQASAPQAALDFASVIQAGVDALIDALPPALAAEIRAHLAATPTTEG